MSGHSMHKIGSVWSHQGRTQDPKEQLADAMTRNLIDSFLSGEQVVAFKDSDDEDFTQYQCLNVIDGGYVPTEDESVDPDTPMTDEELDILMYLTSKRGEKQKGHQQGMAYDDIGSLLGITREGVRQIYNKAIRKLATKLYLNDVRGMLTAFNDYTEPEYEYDPASFATSALRGGKVNRLHNSN